MLRRHSIAHSSLTPTSKNTQDHLWQSTGLCFGIPDPFQSKYSVLSSSLLESQFRQLVRDHLGLRFVLAFNLFVWVGIGGEPPLSLHPASGHPLPSPMQVRRETSEIIQTSKFHYFSLSMPLMLAESVSCVWGGGRRKALLTLPFHEVLLHFKVIVSPPYLWAPNSQIQPTRDQKYFSRKFQKAKLEFATNQQLFILHLYCIYIAFVITSYYE